ncbi:MAG: hypothetical protein ACRD1K_16230 [Acidimicrobiales bacterium]
MRLRLLATTAVLAIGLVGAAPALAQVSVQVSVSLCTPGVSVQYPPSACAVQLSITAGLLGEVVTVRGAGFAANSTVSIEFRSQPVTIGSARTDAAGTFSTTVTIPPGATPGMHTIASVGVNPDNTLRELTAQFTVLGRTSATPRESGGLPRTGGGDTIPLTLAGFGLVTAGTVAVRAARARRRATTA